MATKIRLDMNHAGMVAAMQSAGVQNDLMVRARRIAAAAGHGHMVTGRTGRTRARVSVITATEGARRREATDRALTRALNAGRG